MPKLRSIFGLGLLSSIFLGQISNAESLGSTNVVLTKGVCGQNSGKLMCQRTDNGLPLTFKSCVSGNNTASLETCFNEGDSCFLIESRKYQPDSYCKDARNGSDPDVLAFSVPIGY